MSSKNAVRSGQKKELSADVINELFGIKESFELPEALMKKLLDKDEKNALCNALMKFDIEENTDIFRDYFQTTAANRSQLKQDYTPDCLCELISKLLPDADRVIDICSGTGALTIGTGKDVEFQCEEISSMSIPVLLLNLAFRGKNAVVLQKNVLLNETQKIYKLRKNGRFSDIEVVENYEKQKADVVISNPPYSMKWNPAVDNRFAGYALPPSNASDYAFVLDGLARLDEKGQAFYILPEGVLFRGKSEGEIRKKLIKENLIDAVISLPGKLFLNTSIS